MKLLLGLVLAVAAFVAFHVLNPLQLPLAPQEELRRDPANPYRWADLADSYLAAGDIQRAKTAYHRARTLAPFVPQIWVRAANFFYVINEPQEGLRCAAAAIRNIPNVQPPGPRYAQLDHLGPVLFQYLDRLVPDPASVLAEIGTDRAAIRAYTEHVISGDDIGRAESAWTWTFRHGLADNRLTAFYIDTLLRHHHYDEARRDWAQYLGNNRGDYLSANLLYNGSFEQSPTGSAFDWRITADPQFDTVIDPSMAHEGRSSLRIQFRGNENVTYSNVIQWARVAPGNYRLEAWTKSDSLTTNEGPQVQIYDPEQPGRIDFRLGPFTGTSGWTGAAVSFTVPETLNLIAVRVIRLPSTKFDNKIAGTLWIDSVRLLRE